MSPTSLSGKRAEYSAPPLCGQSQATDNDECRDIALPTLLHSSFGRSSFFRHSSFDIRHFPRVPPGAPVHKTVPVTFVSGIDEGDTNEFCDNSMRTTLAAVDFRAGSRALPRHSVPNATTTGWW